MKDAMNLKLQPLVCVQKIPEKDLPPNQWLSSRIPNQSSQDDEEVEISRPTSSAASSPLKTKTSPRKLRKPRGRWYRER